jgi:stage II sporulation protein D
VSARTVILGAFFLVSIPLYPTLPSLSQQPLSATGYIVRVLIGEKTEHDTPAWHIKSSTGFVLYEPHKPDIRWRSEQDTITIQYHHNQLFLNERECPAIALHILPQDGYATINEQQYHGSFSIICYEQRLLLINHVDLEEYVHAVLRTESWPGWPVEVNKVFAIVSRSYVMAMIHHAQTNPQISLVPYHVKNTNEHQTYKGMHEVRTIRTAIKQTRGVFLMYNNKPALTMFDSCCGGIIPAHIEDFEFEKAPYLAREYACTHCKRCWIYTWKASIPLNEFQEQIAHFLDTPSQINEVAITRYDRAGLVQELTLRTALSEKTVTGKQFYNAFKAIKSFCFSIEKDGDTIMIHGKGFGHHLGLCQWGAREMVRDGWHYRRILSFYYPETQLARLI